MGKLTARSIRRLLGSVATVILVCLVTLELLSAAAAHMGLVPSNMPTYRWPSFRPFWADIDPAFGVWHAAHARYTHVNACYNLEYRANAHGMRDRPRPLDADGARIAMLGDSFVEGYGLARAARVSDRLEAATGLPHLNFGTSGSFGPTQYLMQYESLVRRFDHAGVMINILPDNDFTDDDPDYWKDAGRKRYRPYFFETDAGGYRLDYFDKDALGPSDRDRRHEIIRGTRNVIRNFAYTAGAIDYFQGWITHTLGMAGRKPPLPGMGSYSGYYDYTDEQAQRFEWVLDRLIAATGDKPALIVAIPRPSDVERYRDEGRPPLAELLDDLAGEHPDVAVIDLLPDFARAENLEKLYNSCDGHWSPEGAARAVDIIRNHPDYLRFLSRARTSAGAR